MSDGPDTFLADLRRYEEMISALLRAGMAFQVESESAGALQVERGCAWARALIDPATESLNPLLPVYDAASLNDRRIVDRAGHRRPWYRALLQYSAIQAAALFYDQLPSQLFGKLERVTQRWCEELEQLPGQWDDAPAAAGAQIAEACWNALVLSAGARSLNRSMWWLESAAETFARLLHGQHASGSFLTPVSSDNPETHWYHELVILHAAASFAVQAEDRPLAMGVQRACEYHLQETQPDHASAQPLALFAFIWHAPARTMADQLLHGVQALRPDGVSGIEAILLADALHCLRRFTIV